MFTFAAFVPAFVAFQKGRKRRWEDDRQMINRHILPAWGPLELSAITRKHVHELLDTATGKGLTIGVNRLQALISRIFTVALDRGLIEAHPAARVLKRFSETPRSRTLTDDELRALWQGLDAQPGAASDAVRLRLLLGQRGAETAGMLWAEIDLEAARWSLPGSRTKNRRPHVVALPALALATLVARRLATAAADETRVFPDLSLQGEAHKALASIAGGAYRWTDLRRTVATRIAGPRVRRDGDRARAESRARNDHGEALQPARIPRGNAPGARGLGSRAAAHPRQREETHERPADPAPPLMPRKRPAWRITADDGLDQVIEVVPPFRREDVPAQILNLGTTDDAVKWWAKIAAEIPRYVTPAPFSREEYARDIVDLFAKLERFKQEHPKDAWILDAAIAVGYKMADAYWRLGRGQATRTGRKQRAKAPAAGRASGAKRVELAQPRRAKVRELALQIRKTQPSIKKLSTARLATLDRRSGGREPVHGPQGPEIPRHQVSAAPPIFLLSTNVVRGQTGRGVRSTLDSIMRKRAVTPTPAKRRAS